MDGVKVKKVEERDSVLGSVGGARRTDPNPDRTSLALASGMGIGIWIAMALPLALPRRPCSAPARYYFKYVHHCCSTSSSQ